MSMGKHQSARMATDTWLTPPEILRALGEFDLDPCAAPNQPWRTAKHEIRLPNNGLTAPWNGRVWLNPPYSREAVHWLERMGDHRYGTALVFARTETAWFQQFVWECADAILFLRGRVHFYRPDGTRARANAGAPSCLAAYGPVDAAALEQSEIAGALVRAWTVSRRELVPAWT